MAFLYSLALTAGVDIPLLELGEKAAEVAFRLAERWLEALGQPLGRGVRATQSAHKEDDDNDSQSEDECELPKLSWEVPLAELEGDLTLILHKVAQGERLDVKSFLQAVPVFKGLKQRSEENNHKSDSRNQTDKWLKAHQQRLLNVLPVHAPLHCVLQKAGPEVQAMSQQLWWYLLETENQVLRERKRLSLPGTVQEQANVLFTAEDLRLQNQAQKINQAGTFPSRRKMWHFPIPPGARPFKYRSSGGKGRSFPWKSWSSYGSSTSSWQYGRGRGRGKAKGNAARSWFSGKVT